MLFFLTQIACVWLASVATATTGDKTEIKKVKMMLYWLIDLFIISAELIWWYWFQIKGVPMGLKGSEGTSLDILMMEIGEVL